MSTNLQKNRIFWLQLIICGAFAPVVIFFTRETRGPVLQTKHVASSTASTPSTAEALSELYTTITRSAILLTTELTVSLFTLWSSFAFGLVFISTQSIPLVFGGIYSFAPYSSGLVQTSIGLGQVVGLLACLYQRRLYVTSASRNTQNPGTPVPEAILHLSIPATPLALAGGLFMYGWAIYQPHWIVPALGLGLMGFASMVIINAASIYVTDSYSNYAASAIAAVAFGENIFAAFLPLAAKPMYEKLGYDWASSLLAFVALALTLAPLLLMFNGERIRSKSTFKQ